MWVTLLGFQLFHLWKEGIARGWLFLVLSLKVSFSKLSLIFLSSSSCPLWFKSSPKQIILPTHPPREPLAAGFLCRRPHPGFCLWSTLAKEWHITYIFFFSFSLKRGPFFFFFLKKRGFNADCMKKQILKSVRLSQALPYLYSSESFMIFSLRCLLEFCLHSRRGSHWFSFLLAKEVTLSCTYLYKVPLSKTLVWRASPGEITGAPPSELDSSCLKIFRLGLLLILSLFFLPYLEFS